jgi:hypothetical protein
MVGIEDVRAAAQTVRAVAHRIPLVTCRTVDERVGVHARVAEDLANGGGVEERVSGEPGRLEEA